MRWLAIKTSKEASSKGMSWQSKWWSAQGLSKSAVTYELEATGDDVNCVDDMCQSWDTSAMSFGEAHDGTDDVHPTYKFMGAPWYPTSTYSVTGPGTGATVGALAGGDWLAHQATIVVEEDRRAGFEAPAGFSETQRRSYGDTELVFLKFAWG